MKKPKPTVDTLLMREACGELERFSTSFEAWEVGQYVDPPAPEELFWIAVKYAQAHKRFKMGPNKKGQPF